MHVPLQGVFFFFFQRTFKEL